MDANEWFEIVRKSQLIEANALSAWRNTFAGCVDVPRLAASMIADGMLTDWQSEMLLLGKWKGFFVDHYCLRRRIGQNDVLQTLDFEAMDMRDRSFKILSVVPPARKRRDDGGLIFLLRQNE